MIVPHSVSVAFTTPINTRRATLTLPSQRTINQVIRDVAQAFNVPPDDMRYDRSRYQYICQPRFAAWHILDAMRRDGKRRYSLTQIGRAFDFRDHTTILSGIRRAGILLEHDPDFAARYAEACRG